MAENRVFVEGMAPGFTYAGASLNPLPVILTNNPQVDGAYVASIANVAGTAASNTLMSLYNPVGSGKVIGVAGVFVSTTAAAGTSSTVPMRIHRITAAPTGGSVVGAAAIAKLDTAVPDALAEVRITNPTVTLLAALSNTPPPVTTGAGGGQFVHEIDVPPPTLTILRPGEGIAMNIASGDTAQRWNLSALWVEI